MTLSSRIRNLKVRSAVLPLLGSVAAGLFLSVQSPAQAVIPAYTTTGALGGNSPTNPSSYGFFFDTKATLVIDALGFSSQPGWPTSGKTYTVKLWSFDQFGASPSNYTLKASVDFTPGPGSGYFFESNYFWQEISRITLPRTDIVVDPESAFGYVITAIGDFSGVGGAVQFESGTPTFEPYFNMGGNGYSYVTDPNGFYPIPIYVGPVGDLGYFNPNLSYVPGPLPVLGAASAFGWSRRLRQRIRLAK